MEKRKILIIFSCYFYMEAIRIKDDKYIKNKDNIIIYNFFIIQTYKL